ncbi:MAG: hypothetical protein HY554_01470 [Elusimicrobia bacterium]|nr:hypothetical protein [Elusimicrobiota bacterium]
MEQLPASAPSSAPVEGDALFKDFERHEEEALGAAKARVEELARRARQLLEEHPARLREQLAELQGRIRTGQAECDRRAEMLRATLAAGKVRQEEFRALLVNLEMEYAARCRTAEHGTQLVSEELRSFLNKATAEVSNLCERLRETLESQRGARPRLVEVFRVHEAKARRTEERLHHAIGVLRHVHHRLQTLLAERAASRTAGEEGRHALSELETKLRDLADEAARHREHVGDWPAAEAQALKERPVVPDPENAKLKERLAEALAARDLAEEHAKQAEKGVAGMLSKIAHAEAQMGSDAKPLADLRERVQEALAARDAAQSLADLAAGGLQHLLASAAEHQEKVIIKDRELATVRAEAERARKEAQEAMTRQDGERLKEIFALRAKVEALESRLKAPPAPAVAPPAPAKAPPPAPPAAEPVKLTVAPPKRPDDSTQPVAPLKTPESDRTIRVDPKTASSPAPAEEPRKPRKPAWPID